MIKNYNIYIYDDENKDIDVFIISLARERKEFI